MPDPPSAVPPMSDILRDQIQSSLGAAYTIERELGGGGMSRVFVATEQALGREVVVKVLPPEMAASVSIERFKREIMLAARLQHPHIVPLLAAGESEGLPYFTMPYVQGESLRVRLARGGELPVAEAMRVLREIASALAYAHERGIVHRDIKPDNVLLSGGAAMVTDFGVAKALSASSNADHSGMTSLGVALGTPAYMAPEQASADPAVDHRADIYAFGILSYELLTGQTPFGGRTPQGLLAAHVTESPEPIQKRRSSLPAGLAALVMRCLEKRPADRPQSAAEIVHALDDLTTPSGGMPPAISVSGRAVGPVTGRRPIVAGLAVVAGIAVLAVSVWSVLRTRSRDAAAANVAPHRVVVATFQNRSGDQQLDPVGVMAADWIARGLAGTGIVDVAGTAAELESRAGVKVGSGSDAVVRLGHEARAGIVISGAYYKQGDSLLFQADFTDVAQGKLLSSVGPVSSSVARPLDGVEKLRQRVTGALAPLLDSTLAGLTQVMTNPPSYEAYREFLRGEALFYTDEAAAATALAHAATLDSTYLYPLLREIGVLQNLGRMKEADSVALVVEHRRGALSPYESAFFDLLRATSKYHLPARLDAAQRMVAAAPTAAFPKYIEAGLQNEAGHPRRALVILDSLDPLSGALRGRIYFYSYYHAALHALGEHERSVTVTRRGRAQHPGRLSLVSQELLALAALGRAADISARLDSMGLMQPDRYVTPLGVAAAVLWEARAHDHPEIVSVVAPWMERFMALHARDQSPRYRLNAFAALDAWTRVESLADSLVATDSTDAISMSWSAIAAARRGDRSKAATLGRRIGALSVVARALDGSARLLDTETARLRARANVAAALGDLEGATTLLKSLPADGWETMQYHIGPAFELLRSYPGFQALIKPRG